MSYLVFARKFRPQGFEDVVGQEPIITTLQNAIKQERIPQNFLFAGPRGCGKTSTARILAKALNCTKGPTENPCGKCPSCLEITQGNSMDVLEIDGASNRGIDEIRNLRETVKFKPVNGRMKVYIIDEVHMLTTEAFNALLKTLEEPPPHVKFIFATTESYKVPLTILSRCHRFNFKRIPVQEIAKKLEEVAKAEKLKVDKNALFLIAKTSDGSLRDAEGMLDQLASFSEGKINEEEVLLMLGLASEEIYFSVLGALKEKNAAKIFKIVDEIYEGGKDLVQFSKGILEVFRHLLLLQCTEKAGEFIEMSEEGFAELKKRKNDFSREELLLALSFLGNLQNQLRRNLAPPKLLVEVVLLKLLHLDGYKSVEGLLERSLGTAAATAQGYAPPATSSHGAPRAYAPPPTAERPQTGSPKSQNPAPFSEGRPQAAKPEASTAVAVDFNEVEAAWPRVIEYVKTKKMSTGIFLSEAEPVEVEGETISIGFSAELQFHKETLEKNANRQVVEEAFEVTMGCKVRVQFVVTQADRVSGGAVISKEPSGDSAVKSGKLPEIINEALNIFDGAKIIRSE